MGEGGTILTTVIFALIAVFILARLRSVLGRRTGTERPPVEPYQPPRAATVHQLRPAPAAPQGRDRARSLEAGLAEISAADPSFDEGRFIAGAIAAFRMIVDAYARGDVATLRPLLAPSVLASFESSIKARQAAGETLETTLGRIDTAELVDPHVEDHMALVTVRFVSDQVNLLRDASGAIIDGAPNESVEVTDLWTFARDTRSSDPNWQLIATRTPH